MEYEGMHVNAQNLSEPEVFFGWGGVGSDSSKADTLPSYLAMGEQNVRGGSFQVACYSTLMKENTFPPSRPVYMFLPKS